MSPAAAQTGSEVILSRDQQQAHDAIIAWWEKPDKQLKMMGGLAGTGKTTTLGRVAKTMRSKRKRLRLGFCAFTGKAASVLGKKLFRANASTPDDYIGTIHGLIYKPILDDKKRIKGWRTKSHQELEIDAFVVDEASMVDGKMFDDMKAYGLPILAVGDHGQLPPVTGYLNLMKDPEIRLEHIHRQAEGNPIIRLSMMARQGEDIPFGEYGKGVRKVRDDQSAPIIYRINDLSDMMVICGKNATRVALNSAVRKLLDFTGGVPNPGERVICLKNNRAAGIFNGLQGTVFKIEGVPMDELWGAEIKMDGEESPYRGTIEAQQFGASETLREVGGRFGFDMKDQFDYGYCLTAHKSQGSEARRVLLYDEPVYDFKKSRDEQEDGKRRWRYTAITRAQEGLIIVAR